MPCSLLLGLFALWTSTIAAFVRRPVASTLRHPLSSLGALSDEAKYARASEMVVVIPLANLKGESVLALRKLLPPTGSVQSALIKDSVMPRQRIVEALEGTPFVIALPDVSDGSSLCIFGLATAEDLLYSLVVQWKKTVSVPGILLAYKDRVMKLLL